MAKSQNSRPVCVHISTFTDCLITFLVDYGYLVYIAYYTLLEFVSALVGWVICIESES